MLEGWKSFLSALHSYVSQEIYTMLRYFSLHCMRAVWGFVIVAVALLDARGHMYAICCRVSRADSELLCVVQGKRYSLPNSRIMIHQPLGGAQGQAAGEVTPSHVTICLLHILKQE